MHIDDLRTLAEEGEQLMNLKHLHLDPKFRNWRHQVTSTIRNIAALGYIVGCNIDNRRFTHAPGLGEPVDDQLQRRIYKQDISDTINELRTIVRDFDRKSLSKYIDSTMPTTKDALSAMWLFRNAPLRLWMYFLLLMLIVFLVGVEIGYRYGGEEIRQTVIDLTYKILEIIIGLKN